MARAKIVIVDDEADIALIVSKALETRGFECYAANDGLAGKELIEKVRPDVAILDIKMPKMSGYELAAEIKKNPRLQDTAVIIMTSLTADSGKTDEQWRDSIGTDDFISKPFEPDELVNRVEALVKPVS